MKVGTLITKLQAVVEQLGPAGLELEVKGWLPGTTMSISEPFLYKDVVRIEMNVDPGSAIDRMINLN